ncbi:unnamed protein product, partial [Larinioides sclopetarius]
RPHVVQWYARLLARYVRYLDERPHLSPPSSDDFVVSSDSTEIGRFRINLCGGEFISIIYNSAKKSPSPFGIHIIC